MMHIQFGCSPFLLFRVTRVLTLAGALAVSLSARAWEPADASKTTDPGWYRAGETATYATPPTSPQASHQASPQAFPHASPYTPLDQGKPGSNAYGSGVWSDWSGSKGRGDGYGYGYAHDEGRDQWGSDGRGEYPAEWRDVEGNWSGWSPNDAAASAAGYRFRGDPAPRHGWQAPANFWGQQYGGYRFREDQRLDSKFPAVATDPRYHFRPLSPEDSARESAPEPVDPYREHSASPPRPW